MVHLTDYVVKTSPKFLYIVSIQRLDLDELHHFLNLNQAHLT